MLLGLPPAKYVVMPHYEAKLKQLLETANDMDAGLPLEYEITTLQVGAEHKDRYLATASLGRSACRAVASSVCLQASCVPWYGRWLFVNPAPSVGESAGRDT
jgi:hypothetical protein